MVADGQSKMQQIILVFIEYIFAWCCQASAKVRNYLGKWPYFLTKSYS